MKTLSGLLLPLFCSLSFFSSAFGAELVIPKLTSPLMDQVGLIKAGDSSRIDREIRELNDQGKAQITVFIPNSLQGYDIETFSIKVAEAWKLGDRELDRGLLLVIAPHERKMRLEVGYGLEGSIPDAMAKRILDDQLKPLFRESRFAEGIEAVLIEISNLTEMDASGVRKPVVRQTGARMPDSKAQGGGFLLVVMALFLLSGMGLFWLMGLFIGAGSGWLLGGLFGVTIAQILGAVFGGSIGLAMGRAISKLTPADWAGLGGDSSVRTHRRNRGWGGSSGGGFGGFGGGGGGWGGGGGSFGGGGASSGW